MNPTGRELTFNSLRCNETGESDGILEARSIQLNLVSIGETAGRLPFVHSAGRSDEPLLPVPRPW